MADLLILVNKLKKSNKSINCKNVQLSISYLIKSPFFDNVLYNTDCQSSFTEINRKIVDPIM